MNQFDAGSSPYRPPGAPLADAAVAPFRWRAALAGGAAGIGLVYVVWALLGPLFRYWLISSGVEPGRVYSAMIESTAYNVVGHLLKIVGITIGALAAAQLAAEQPFAHALASVVLPYLAVAGNYFNGWYFPLWSQALGILIPVPCALLGAWLYTAHKTRL